MAMLYVDCESCRCLIRAQESQCPFCEHRPSVISNAGGTLRMFGLAAGLAAATMSCAAEDTMPVASATGEESSVNDDHDADAVTYAGPDDASITDPGETITTDPTTTTSPDPTDADAVTYAGPDESSGTSETTDAETETTSTGTDTTSSGTEESSTGSSGTGDTDPNG